MLMQLFQGGGNGSNLKTAKGTVWGMVNAVTEYVDHHKGRSSDVRMDRAWFGDGQNIKALAVQKANEIALLV
jgi:outer membrane lipoprotein SlyB